MITTAKFLDLSANLVSRTEHSSETGSVYILK